MKYTVMFWNKWNEAILFGTTSVFFFDTEEECLDFIEAMSVQTCVGVSINDAYYEVLSD